MNDLKGLSSSVNSDFRRELREEGKALRKRPGTAKKSMGKMGNRRFAMVLEGFWPILIGFWSDSAGSRWAWSSAKPPSESKTLPKPTQGPELLAISDWKRQISSPSPTPAAP